MSLLMADSLKLGLGDEPGVTVEVTNEEQYEGAKYSHMEYYEERVRSAKKRKEMESIQVNLRNVHARIAIALDAAGYSTELPEPCLNQKSKNNLPSACPKDQKTRKYDETKEKWKILLSNFIDSHSEREELINRVAEWLSMAQLIFSTSVMKRMEFALMKRQKEEERMFSGINEALESGYSIVKKFQEFGRTVFDDQEPTENPNKSSMNGDLQHKFNKKFRRASMKIDGMPRSQRSAWMKHAIPINELHDFQNVVAELDETDASEKSLLQDVTQNWKAACTDVRDLMISVHEERMLKKSAKMNLRRALFLFKTIIASQEIKNRQVKELESKAVDLEAEVTSLRAKNDHIHKEVKKWREKFTHANSAITRLNKENRNLKAEIEKLNGELESAVNKLDEQANLINELRESLEEQKESVAEAQVKVPEVTKIVSHVEDDERLREADEQIVRLHEFLQEQKTKISEMEEAINASNQAREDDAMRENYRIMRDREEMEELQKTIQTEREKCERLEHHVSELTGKLVKAERENEGLIADLGAKEEMIKNLTLVQQEEEEEEDEPMPTFRKNSMQFEILAKSSANLLRPRKSSLLRASSTRMFQRPSKSRCDIQQEEPEAKTTPVASKSSITEDRNSSTGDAAIETPAPAVNNAELIRITQENFYWKEKCTSLELDLTQAEKYYVESEKKHKTKLSSVIKEKKIALLNAEENNRQKMQQLYKEALNVEGFLNEYKHDLADMFEGASYHGAAKEALNAYNYNSAEAPSDFKQSLETTNKWIETSFTRFMEAQRRVLKQVRLAHAQLVLKAEQAAGQEASHYIKVLSSKSIEMEKLNKYISSLKDQNEKLVEQNHSLSHRSVAMAQQLDTIEAEAKKKYFPDRDEKIKMGDELTGEKAGTPAHLMQEGLILRLKDTKEELARQKRRNSVLQHCLKNETHERQQAERLLAQYQHGELASKPAQQTNSDNAEIKKIDNIAVRQKVKAKSRVGRFSQMLQKMSALEATVRLSHLDESTVTEANQAVEYYKFLVRSSFVDFVDLYIRYQKLKTFQVNMKAAIVLARRNRQREAVLEIGEEEIRVEVKELQRVYWHVECKIKAIVDRKVMASIVTKTTESRVYVSNLFRKVAEILLHVKQTTMHDDQNAMEFKVQAQAVDEFENTESEISRNNTLQMSAEKQVVRNTNAPPSPSFQNRAPSKNDHSQIKVTSEDNRPFKAKKSKSAMMDSISSSRIRFSTTNFGRTLMQRPSTQQQPRRRKLHEITSTPVETVNEEPVSWRRRSSLVQNLPLQNTPNLSQDIPLSLQLDVQSDLRRASKVLLKNIKRNDHVESVQSRNIETDTGSASSKAITMRPSARSVATNSSHRLPGISDISSLITTNKSSNIAELLLKRCKSYHGFSSTDSNDQISLGCL